MKPQISIVLVAIILAAICASLGWFGITEHLLTTGGKFVVKTSYGLSAVVQGWFWIAAAFGFIAILVARSGFRNIIWFGMFLFYIACQAMYWLSVDLTSF